MKVVISGGTGFIGRGVALALLARGDEVTVLTRNVERARSAVDPRVRLAAWDAARIETFSEEIRRSDAVLHLAGEGVVDKRWTAARKAELRASRIETTAAIARAVAASAADGGPKVLVSASAIGYYGMRDDDTVCTEGGPTGNDFLAELSRDWERAAEPARIAGIRVAHPRIGVVLGPDGGALAKMLTPFKMFVGGPIGSGRQWFSWIHEADAIAALLFGIDNAALAGPYNLVSPNPVTMNEFARVLGDVLGRPSLARVPAFAMKLAMGDEMANVLLKGQRVVPLRLEELGFEFHFPTLTAALENLVVAHAA